MKMVIDQIFKNKKANRSKLLSFGFTSQDERLDYTTNLVNGQFQLMVSVQADGGVKTKVIDNEFKDAYVLHLTSCAVGGFVGRVRSEYQAVLQQIADTCFEAEVFKSAPAQAIIRYVSDKYGDELEFLWPKLSDNAIWRRKDNQKWYAVILVVSKRKLGLDSDEIVEVIDLRMPPEQLEAIVDNQTYFRGYHMNKKHWISLCLDGSIPVEEICSRLDESYRLAKKA